MQTWGNLVLRIIHRHIVSRLHIRQERFLNDWDIRNMRLNLQRLPDICMILEMQLTEHTMQNMAHFLQMIC